MFCEKGEFLQVQQEGRNLLHNLALQLGGNASLSESHPLPSVAWEVTVSVCSVQRHCPFR